MEPVIIKLGRKDDIATIIKKIKDLRERDVVFELEKGSTLLSSSANLRLIKKTGEVLGKKIRVSTNDPMGKMIARKAEMLAGDDLPPEKMPRSNPRIKRSDVKSRFSDIISPNKRILPVSTVQSLSIKMPAIASRLPRLRLKNLASGFGKKFVFAITVLVVILFALAVILPKAQITVYARSEPVTRDFEIQVDHSIQDTDAANLKIPADLVTKEVSDTKTFTTTGVRISGTKATGSVLIYNQTSATLKLRAQTTALVAGGKNFHFTADVSGIKPKAQIGPVSIGADEPGDAANLAANTKFQIKNAALGNREVYAVNPEALTGGTSNGVKIFSQEDFDRAVAAMSDQLVGIVQDDLDLTILPSGANVEILAKTANKEVGDEAESFDFTMIGRVKGLTYKESGLKSVIRENINNLLSSDKYLLDNKDQINAKFKSVDLAATKGILSVHFETMVAYKIDTSSLPKLLSGKNAQQIKEILLTKPEIDRVDVKFSPFFVNRAPRFNGKIHIETKLNES